MTDSSLCFLPLGGTGEIGMNVSLYKYRDKWIMIDCGAGFADADLPGIDIIVADVSFIEQRKDDLLGIIITHAHEDHCGALPYLWDKLGAPVYTTQFTANFIVKKIGYNKVHFPIHVVEPGVVLNLGEFVLEFVNLTHSVPEMSAIAIHTEEGVVFHSGDWKIDDDPVVGEASDFARLEELREKGVLAMICDSTNVFSEGRSKSESVLHAPLKESISEAKGACVVTLFSSNIGRIETITRIANELGKTVVVLGRSLLSVISAAKETGYLNDLNYLDAVGLEHYKGKREKLIVLSTGCQGDELASVNRLSLGTHTALTLKEGDTVIFSSKMIPGNEKRIAKMINRFIAMHVSVITERTHTVHVSGHPYRDELKQMYQLLKPNTVIPVHGENLHLYEHAKFAEKCGVKNSLVAADGDIIEISKAGGAQKIGKTDVGFWCVDNEELQHPDSHLIKTRKKLQSAGMILVVLIMNKKMRLIRRPSIATFGYSETGGWKENALVAIEKDLRSERNVDFKTITKATRKIVRNSLIYKNKIPLIEIQIERV
ncbi:metallo-beta-lactamase superfamily protein [Neorickettsia helminthoeca str. Oregon]|uniref:Metallo-beta-lactamase superfamily protein n=1 Tax=Neorickettsia helminthoeca str. Oregon TaxID=1286528 RepID=X5HML6_9RICK|nr:ribonuclease J [Neorickettsia helminthoeca]AHX11720.1 metallo-beta-lactamase superfamily protein [Neorickettsia helminthoeca str. Oregon]